MPGDLREERSRIRREPIAAWTFDRTWAHPWLVDLLEADTAPAV
jgi:hypothetical protein